MNNILIATDFSPAANGAANYAAKLAAALHAKLTLVSAFQETPVPVDGIVALGSTNFGELTQYSLEEEVDRLRLQQPLVVESLARPGATTPAILEAAEETHADLIVAGMSSTGKGTRKVFGSTATALARRTTLPLLIVPETAEFTPPAAIALADDVIREKDRALPALLKDLLDRFHSRFFLIRIFNEGAGEIVEILHQNGPERMIGAFSPFADAPAGKPLVHALDKFVGSYPIDILVMRPQPKSLVEQWLFGSHTRDMIFETNIPLLIIPEKIR
ncbi:MAG TPA: universal stress protein [Puia sp.]|nr:universal stress protein [Puia sp.]